jgi:maleylacetoacetate isomerase
MTALRLYHFATSNSSWRVRWAIALKEIDVELVTVDLATGENHEPAHLARNPLGQVPVLERIGAPDPFLFETVAIIDWLDRGYPEPRLIPEDDGLRARAFQLAEIINADTHPLQNRSTGFRHSEDADERLAWNRHWVSRGLAAYETVVAPIAGTFSLGEAISYPDLFLIPMCRNAVVNYQLDLSETPTVARIYAAARATEAARTSEPERFLTGVPA